jgi:DNA invertase Pin-like site-specific DNA recombinase
MIKIGYCRVSTKTQLEGNGLEAQEKEILCKYDNADIRKEQYTGKSTERPILNNVIGSLGNGDLLIVTKLDRLARNTLEGIKIIEELFKKGINVHVLNVGLLENTHMGKFFITTLLAVAEMERTTILERMQSGKEIAKTKEGYKEGRPIIYTTHQLDWCIDLVKTNSLKQVERMTKISTSTIKRELKKRGLTATMLKESI